MDQTVCLVDCRDSNKQTRWTFDSDIERVTWNNFDTNQFLVNKIVWLFIDLINRLCVFRHQQKMVMSMRWTFVRQRFLFLVYPHIMVQ